MTEYISEKTHITPLKAGIIFLLSLYCAVFFTSPAKSTVSDCDFSQDVVINWGKVASLKNGLDGIGDFIIKCKTDSGRAKFCAYINDAGPIYGDDTTEHISSYTLYDGATNVLLGSKNHKFGPLIGSADIGGGSGTQRSITIQRKIRLKIPPQREKFTAPQRFGSYASSAVAVGDSDNFESSCQSWNGNDNAGGWADTWSTFSPWLTMSFWLETYCSIDSVGTLDFGKVPSLNDGINGQTDITLDCSLGTKYAIGMNQGNNFREGSRNMKSISADNFVRYELYQDSAHTLPWGMKENELYKNTSSSLLPVRLPVYGHIPPQGSAAAGKYADQAVVTVKITGVN